jgi:hypothetical protein
MVIGLLEKRGKGVFINPFVTPANAGVQLPFLRDWHPMERRKAGFPRSRE